MQKPETCRFQAFAISHTFSFVAEIIIGPPHACPINFSFSQHLLHDNTQFLLDKLMYFVNLYEH